MLSFSANCCIKLDWLYPGRTELITGGDPDGTGITHDSACDKAKFCQRIASASISYLLFLCRTGVLKSKPPSYSNLERLQGQS